MITLVAGTRPNFMKIAPVRAALVGQGQAVRVIHTGQHYDPGMSEVFFRDLEMPPPDAFLNAGGGSQAQQTATVLVGVESDLLECRPEAIVVVGDVTSTVAAALAASKLGIPVVHVEAGLRSSDWTMPEEINRVVTDRISDLLLIPSPDARTNLMKEGVDERRVIFVGNVMIDSLLAARRHPTDVLRRLGLVEGSYAAVTLHRPSNVDSASSLSRTLDVLESIARELPVVFPVHPRTIQRVKTFGMTERLAGIAKLQLTDPLGYLDFVTLTAGARLVATDSGGLQEETTALGIPCLTLREGTERPITVTDGTNTVVGLDSTRVAGEVRAVMEGRGKHGRIPEGWDGHAGERCAEAIVKLTRGEPEPRTAGPRA